MQEYCHEEKRAARTRQHKAEVRDDLQTEWGCVPEVDDQRGRRDPQQERRDCRSKPPRPAPCQQSIGREQAILDPVGTDAETGEKIDRIVKRPTELEREWPQL